MSADQYLDLNEKDRDRFEEEKGLLAARFKDLAAANREEGNIRWANYYERLAKQVANLKFSHDV